MEHLTNCHGEWNLLFALIASVPILGTWIKLKFGGKNAKQQSENSCDSGHE